MNNRYLTCEEVVEQLFVYLDKELDERHIADIEHHLERCRDCYTRAEFEKKLRVKVADSVQEQAPDRLRRRIEEMLGQF